MYEIAKTWIFDGKPIPDGYEPKLERVWSKLGEIKYPLNIIIAETALIHGEEWAFRVLQSALRWHFGVEVNDTGRIDLPTRILLSKLKKETHWRRLAATYCDRRQFWEIAFRKLRNYNKLVAKTERAKLFAERC